MAMSCPLSLDSTCRSSRRCGRVDVSSQRAWRHQKTRASVRLYGRYDTDHRCGSAICANECYVPSAAAMASSKRKRSCACIDEAVSQHVRGVDGSILIDRMRHRDGQPLSLAILFTNMSLVRNAFIAQEGARCRGYEFYMSSLALRKVAITRAERRWCSSTCHWRSRFGSRAITPRSTLVGQMRLQSH